MIHYPCKYMKSIYALLLLLLLAGVCRAQFPTFEKTYAVKPYILAIGITNPASAMLKVGGSVEDRRYRTSYLASYHIYTGAYFGKQYDAEWRWYFRKYMRHITNKWVYQDFFYFRSILGEMGYDGQKFAILGQKEDKFADPQFYLGSAPGYGRRYHKGALFFTIRSGIRVLTIPDLDEQYKSLYRLFYFTGPGSIVEVNFQAGIQL